MFRVSALKVKLPMLHRLPKVADEVKRTFWPTQSRVEPPGVMVGGVGASVIEITTGAEVDEVHPWVRPRTV